MKHYHILNASFFKLKRGESIAIQKAEIHLNQKFYNALSSYTDNYKLRNIKTMSVIAKQNFGYIMIVYT